MSVDDYLRLVGIGWREGRGCLSGYIISVLFAGIDGFGSVIRFHEKIMLEGKV